MRLARTKGGESICFDASRECNPIGEEENAGIEVRSVCECYTRNLENPIVNKFARNVSPRARTFCERGARSLPYACFTWEINTGDQVALVLCRKSLPLIIDLPAPYGNGNVIKKNRTDYYFYYRISCKRSFHYLPSWKEMHACLKMHLVDRARFIFAAGNSECWRDKRLLNLILLARVIFIKSDAMKFSDESRD